MGKVMITLAFCESIRRVTRRARLLRRQAIVASVPESGMVSMAGVFTLPGMEHERESVQPFERWAFGAIPGSFTPPARRFDG
jgi:hypothetical protein